MNGFEKRKERKKDSIRQAALELFRSLGFRKVSIAEIARKAGVSQVTIYNTSAARKLLSRRYKVVRTRGFCRNTFVHNVRGTSFPEKLEEIVLDKSNIAGEFQGELLTTYMKINPELRAYIDEIAENQGRSRRTAFLPGRN